MPVPVKNLLLFALAFLLAWGLSLATGQPSQAQFSVPESLGQNNNFRTPREVTRYGNLETVAVKSPLTAKTLFTIASPTVYNRSPDLLGSQQPVEQRAEEVGARLTLLVNRPMEPKTLVLDVSRLNKVKIIRARDDRFTEPLILMSVTELDSQFNGLPVEQLTEQWRVLLEQELRTGLENLPADQKRIRHILLGLIILTAIVVLVKYSLFQQQQGLRQQKQAIQATTPLANEPQAAELISSLAEQLAQKRSHFLQQVQHLFGLDRQLGALDFAQWLLFWLLMLAWYGGGLWVAWVSPYLVRTQFRYVEVPIELLGIWFFTGLLIRLSRYLIDRLITRWHGPMIRFIDLGDIQRRQLRASTIAEAMKGLVSIVILTLGLLWALGALGLPTASTVAIVGVLALAVSFGSRRLVEDLVNGFLSW